MTKQITIPVPGPGLVTHEGTVSTVILREPTYDEYLSIGEPVTLAKAPDGTIFQVENGETIRQYIKGCLVAPKDPLLLEPGGFRLARAVKGAVLGFFRDEASGGEPSTTSPTTSSSDAVRAASTPSASAA